MRLFTRTGQPGPLRRAGSRRHMRRAALGLVGAGCVLLLGVGGRALWRFYRGDAVIPAAVVTGVEQLDIGHTAAFTVRTPDGRDLRFVAHPNLNQTPGHLRDHMTFADPVRIHYSRQGGTLVANLVFDADAGSHP